MGLGDIAVVGNQTPKLNQTAPVSLTLLALALPSFVRLWGQKILFELGGTLSNSGPFGQPRKQDSINHYFIHSKCLKSTKGDNTGYTNLGIKEKEHSRREVV